MQLPNERLDDFDNIDVAPKDAEPPAVKSLQRTGRVEYLKPLARSDQLVRFRAATGRIVLRPEPLPRPRGISWYHRSLALSGIVAAGALMLGILAGIYAPPEPTVVSGGQARNIQPGEMPAHQMEAEAGDISSSTSSPPQLSRKAFSPRKVEKRRSIRPSSRGIASRQQPTRPPQIAVSAFVPTTLVIYVENGEVKTRIEPQIGNAHKKKT